MGTMISRFTSRKGLCAGIMVTAASTFTLGCFVYHTQGPGPSQASLSSSILQQHALRRRLCQNPVFTRLAKAMPAGAVVETGQPTPRRRRLPSSSCCCWPTVLTYGYWFPPKKTTRPYSSYSEPNPRWKRAREHMDDPKWTTYMTAKQQTQFDDYYGNVSDVTEAKWTESAREGALKEAARLTGIDMCNTCNGDGIKWCVRRNLIRRTCGGCGGRGKKKRAPKRQGFFWDKSRRGYVPA